MTAVGLGAVAVQVHETSVRMGVDTPIQAVKGGEPDCITAAAFVGPDGQRRLVNQRRYRSNCVDEQPGEQSPSPSRPPTPTAQLYRDDETAHLVHDYAIQRLDVLLSEVRAELALPAEARTSTPNDASLAKVRSELEAVRRAMSTGALAVAEEHYDVIQRRMHDDWRRDSPLAERLLAFWRAMLRG